MNHSGYEMLAIIRKIDLHSLVSREMIIGSSKIFKLDIEDDLKPNIKNVFDINNFIIYISVNISTAVGSLE